MDNMKTVYVKNRLVRSNVCIRKEMKNGRTRTETIERKRSEEDLPHEFLVQGQFPLVLGLLQLGPGTVDVTDEQALRWGVGLLVVHPHLVLDCEQLHLQVTLLHKPAVATLRVKH